MLPNVPAYVITWLALARLGAVMVPVNTAYTPREVAYVLENAEASYLVIHSDFLPIYAQCEKAPVDAKNVIHVASVHAYNAAEKTMTVVKGSGGLSDKPSELEGNYAWGWARNIWADSLA